MKAHQIAFQKKRCYSLWRFQTEAVDLHVLYDPGVIERVDLVLYGTWAQELEQQPSQAEAV